MTACALVILYHINMAFSIYAETVGGYWVMLSPVTSGIRLFAVWYCFILKLEMILFSGLSMI